METKFIAELGVNHFGVTDIIKTMINKSVEANADYIKLQMYDTEGFKRHTYYEQLKQTHLSKEQLIDISCYCKGVNIKFMCTPTKPDHVDFLETIDINAYKIRYIDNANKSLIKKITETNKPIFVSIDNNSAGHHLLYEYQKTNFMYCIPEYPPKTFDAEKFISNIELIRGFSNHYPTIHPAVIACAVGANVIEMHVTLSHELPCIDRGVSVDFKQLKKLISWCKGKDK